MRKHFIAAILAASTAAGAFAQADTSAHNPAVKSPTVHTTAMAAKGRNSFTEAQARGRIAKDGLHRCEQAREGQQRRLARYRHEGRRQGERGA